MGGCDVQDGNGTFDNQPSTSNLHPWEPSELAISAAADVASQGWDARADKVSSALDVRDLTRLASPALANPLEDSSTLDETCSAPTCAQGSPTDWSFSRSDLAQRRTETVEEAATQWEEKIETLSLLATMQGDLGDSLTAQDTRTLEADSTVESSAADDEVDDFTLKMLQGVTLPKCDVIDRRESQSSYATHAAPDAGEGGNDGE